MAEAMQNFAKVTPSRPHVFALSDPVTIEHVHRVPHRALLTVHVGSWFSNELMTCRQMAAHIYGVFEESRDDVHISVDWVV
jgi:hypothetical protein